MSEETKVADLQKLCERAYLILNEHWDNYTEDGYGPSSLLADLKKAASGKEYRDLSKLCDFAIRANQELEQTKAQLAERVERLEDAAKVALGHLTGGMDGDWIDCDPADLLRTALSEQPTETDSANKN